MQRVDGKLFSGGGLGAGVGLALRGDRWRICDYNTVTGPGMAIFVGNWQNNSRTGNMRRVLAIYDGYWQYLTNIGNT